MNTNILPQIFYQSLKLKLFGVTYCDSRMDDEINSITQ